MVRITEQLLRKRAEHNEGKLFDIEEISLHQLEIERIELLDVYGKHLQILLMQNNQIPKIEGLRKLKELGYLNLALNNLEIVEGLDRCESLKKLDLTCNFVTAANLLQSLRHLSKCPSLEEVHFLGTSFQIIWLFIQQMSKRPRDILNTPLYQDFSEI